MPRVIYTEPFLVQSLSRSTRPERVTAYLGDGDGRIYVAGQLNRVYVRTILSTDQYGNPQYGAPMIVRTNITVQEYPNLAVWIELQENKEWAITQVANPVNEIAGVPNTAIVTAAPSHRMNWVISQSWATGATFAVATENTPSLKIGTNAFWFKDSRGTLVDYAGGQVDLTTHVPTVGNQTICVIGIRQSDMTAQAYSATPIAVGPYPLNDPASKTAAYTTITTILAAAPIDLIPLAAWYLANAQTTINDRAYLMDLRNHIATPSRQYALTTTNATTTTLTTVSVAQLSAVTVIAHMVASKPDFSAAFGGRVMGVFRRASGGNVTIVGTLESVLKEDISPKPAFTLAANTTNQTVDVNVTGTTAQTWDWRVTLEVLRV